MLCLFGTVSLSTQKLKKIIDLPLLTFSVVSLLPFLIYYGYGILFAGFMNWKVSTSFMPYLLIKKDFWLGWSDNVINEQVSHLYSSLRLASSFWEIERLNIWLPVRPLDFSYSP